MLLHSYVGVGKYKCMKIAAEQHRHGVNGHNSLFSHRRLSSFFSDHILIKRGKVQGQSTSVMAENLKSSSFKITCFLKMYFTMFLRTSIP